MWKEYCSYDLHKKSLDKINIYNIKKEDYIEKLQGNINSLNEKLGKQDISEKIYNIFEEFNWCCKCKLQYVSFDNIIDEKTYQYFKNNLENKLDYNIQGLITGDKLIIFYEIFYLIKFLYHGQLINQGINNNNSLIQLTADFSQISNGIYDKYSTRDAYNGFKKLIQKNINFAFKLLDNQNINYSKEETINFSSDI